MSSEEQLVPGMQIKNYILEEQLGKGASGEVWKASDGMKTVALKLMNPQLLTSRNVAKHLERMEREISALGRLQSHPNIPSIFDYDLNYERPYMAMQFIGGASYEKLIKSGDMLRIPLNNRLRMIRELAMALAAAHRENIIHRDIKPANASGTENPYLLDFSVALPEEDLQKTQANIGTKLYMPWDGIPDKLGDIYSFGLLAYEIIFGRHAIFRPEDNAMLKATPFMPQVVAGERIKNREWHVPSKLSLDEVPADLVGKDLHPLDDVFQKVLGSRTQRYEDPRIFAEDLRRAIEEGLAPPQYPDNVIAAAPAAPPPPPVQPPPASPPVQPPPEPVRAEPPTPVPPDVVEDAATVVEDLSIASTPHESYIPPDDVQPTVVEPPAAPPAPSVTMPPDDFDGGKTVLDMPAAPRPTPPPASQTPMPVRQEPPPAPPAPPQEPPRRPPSLEPERPVPAPPMPVQSEILVGTQLEAEPPRPASSRSPVVFVVAGVAAFFLIGIIAVLLISGSPPPPENPTVTPGEVIQEATTEPTTEVPTLVALVATEVLETATPTEIPPTATRRPTDTPVPVTETPVPTYTPMPPTETPLPTDTPVPPTDTVEPPTATLVPPTAAPVLPSDTPVPPTVTPIPPTSTHTPLPTDTTEPPTVTPVPTDTSVPPTETPLPTDTPVPPTATRVPSSTPTLIPPTATRRPTETAVIAQVDATATEAVPTEIAASPTPSLIPPTATRVGDEATPTPDVPTPTPTPEGLSANLGDNIRLLRAAILGDRYQCSVFNDVYEHLQTRLSGDFEDNAAYERYGNDILREMARIYRGFCRTRDTDDERLPRRYEEDNSDLDVLLDDILDALALTATPTLTPTP